MADIKEVILQSNPWWKEKFEPHFKPREVYAQIKNFLKLPQIIAFTGLRRVGKTTIMYKIIEDSIKGGFDPKNIVYFSFDEFRDIRIKEVLDRYEELLEKNLREGKYIFLFDEIQKVNNWEEQIKRIYDLFKDKGKIIISGSEALFIKKKSKETLAGRIFEFKVERLSFKEFLGFKDISYKPVSIYEKELKKAFSEFVLTLGFPELVGVKEKEVIKKYVKESIVDRVVYKRHPIPF
jgi:predicted AAA+ superfamily ATPase